MPVSKVKEKKKSYNWKEKAIIFLAPYLYRTYMWIVFHTSKKSYIGYSGLNEMMKKREGFIAAAWHQTILLLTYNYRHKNVAAIASRSRDGDILAAVLSRIGFITFRGSSSKGGSDALRSITKFLNTEGLWASIAVDGPRGPYKEVKPGIILLAQKTGNPIYPLHSSAKRKIMLNSWDKTIIPLPFNHIVFICGDPVRVPENAGKPILQQKKEDIESSLKDIADKAEAYLT